MVRYLIAVVFLFVGFSRVHATWSIILIDPKTNEIGIAGASCTYNCYGIGEIIPNVGAVIVQAMSNNEARKKGLAMILAEVSPERIIEALRDPVFDPERQQYAIITLKFISDAKIFTGSLTNSYKGGLTDYGVSVQGNTLTSPTVLNAVMTAVKTGRDASLSISEILMAALEAGAVAGGDKRCGEQKATSAFIVIAKPNDKKPYLNLQIFGQGKGNQNAVTMLRAKFERWKRKHS